MTAEELIKLYERMLILVEHPNKEERDKFLEEQEKRNKEK